MIWVVVPLARPHMLANVRANFARQCVPAKLCIVENGAGLGACAGAGFEPDLLLSSENHQAVAKNVAIRALRRRASGDLLCFWDDDDYYGDMFLCELAQHWGRATVIGKRRHFARLQDGEIYLFDRDGADRLSPWLHGPTCLVRAAEMLEFPEVRLGEDALWCKAMAAAGATFWATSVWNYLYDRSRPEPRAWEASDVMVRFQLGASVKFGPEPDRFVARSGARALVGTHVPEPTPAELAAMMDGPNFTGPGKSGTFGPEPLPVGGGS